MIDNFDAALTAFETDVHEGKANVHIVSRNGRVGGRRWWSVDWWALWDCWHSRWFGYPRQASMTGSGREG